MVATLDSKPSVERRESSSLSLGTIRFYSLMDRTHGYGPCDEGSNPSRTTIRRGDRVVDRATLER
jgi:hypothetical protein